MEDSHISDLNIGESDIHIFGVFDGHGGREVARFVKNHFTEELLENINFKKGNYKEAMIETFLRIDDLLIEADSMLELKEESKKSKEDDKTNDKNMDKSQMELFNQLFGKKNIEEENIAMHTGCTACACLVDQKSLYFTNAGDSRAILCRDGIAYAMSEDHKPDLPGEKDRIYKAEGWVSEGRVKGFIIT